MATKNTSRNQQLRSRKDSLSTIVWGRVEWILKAKLMEAEYGYSL